MTFREVIDPGEIELQGLQAANPANPFDTTFYVSARRALGAKVVLFAVENANVPRTAAVGYLSGRAIGRTLELTSAPSCSNTEEFWDGVWRFCRQHHVADVSVGSFCTESVTLPTWSAPSKIRDRTEWVVQLDSPEPPQFGSNHRRNIKKASKLGITVTSTSELAAADVHCQLMAQSIQRRAQRGEKIPGVNSTDTAYARAFLQSGAARLFQAYQNEMVISSLLVLHSSLGAYYQSAGTTTEGFDLGASTFLVSEIIRLLASEGKSVFNLGGTSPGAEAEGLRRFKSGFGARSVPLSAASYSLAGPVQKGLQAAARVLRDPVHIGKSWSERGRA
ncbi:MAG: GNAT family N-acetyltransferase [Gemmatimonadaceae bacterium]